MPNPQCAGQRDEVLSARIAYLLMLRFTAADRRELEQRREQLRYAFRCLSPSAAKPLLERLELPDHRDPLTVLFMRLATATREELLGLLQSTLGSAPPPVVDQGPGSLPHAAGGRLLSREVESRLSAALNVPKEQRLTLAENTLRALRSIAADPRFADADRAVVREIEIEAAAIERRLEEYALAREQNFTRVKRRDVSWGAVGFVAVLDGPEPGPADAIAGLFALGLFLFAAKTVTVARDPGLQRQQAEDLGELLRNANARLAQVAQRVAPARPIAPQQPEPSRPTRTVDVSPPIEVPTEEKKRRRRPCERIWVERRPGGPHVKYHNEFAAAIVVKFKIPASPEQDYRITKGGRKSTDYDSYDFETNTYYEFKSRHDYLPFEDLTITWLRMSGIVAQAWDQRMTMITCGIDADLVWVFEDPRVATAAREYIGGWPVDRVLAESWEGRRPKRRGKGPADSEP